jgi:RNA polymerase sigma factor (sigma-70 family)
MMRGEWKAVIQQVDRLYGEGTSSGWADDQLLARFATARAESDLAFEAIVQRHGPMVLETCRRVLGGDRHAAEDAFQATFLVLARRAGSIVVGPSGSLGPWLHQVAWRTARNARVAAARRAIRERRSIEGAPAVIERDQSSALIDEDYRILHEEVARLPEKYRAAVVLCYFEGLTHDQAAASLHRPVGTVHSYLARARDLLRTRLIRRGLAPAVAAGVLAHPSPSAAMTLAPALMDAVRGAVARGAINTTVAALARSMTRGLFAAKLRRALTSLVVLALGIGGVGLTASYFPTSTPPARPPRPIAPESAGSSRVDVQGDPLPEGAAARIGTTRFNHGTLIQTVAYAPDGSVLASAGAGAVRLWDPSTGREICQLGQTANLQPGLAFSPDGRTLAVVAVGREGTIILFDVASGRERKRSVPLKGSLLPIAFAPDGQTLATALGGSDAVILWDVDSLKESRRIRAHVGGTHALAFAPDGRSLATASDSTANSAALFDVATGREWRRLPFREGRLTALTISRDCRLLAVGLKTGSIWVIDLSTGQMIRQLSTAEGIKCLRFSPDRTILASGETEDGPRVPDPARDRTRPGPKGIAEGWEPSMVTLWDVATGRKVHCIPAHIQWINDLAFAPDGRTLATCGAETVIRLWDVATGRERLGADRPRTAIRSVAISPEGRHVITGGYDGTIREWDPSTGRPLRLVGCCGMTVQDLAYTPDGAGLVTGSYDYTCRLWDLASGEERRRFDVVNGWIRNVAVSPDGRSLFSAMKVFDLATGRLKTILVDPQGKEYANANYADGLFTRDSAGVMVGDDGGVVLFDASSGRRLGLVAKPVPGYYVLALSDDGRVLATGDVMGGPDYTLTDPSIRLWEVASGRELARLGGDGSNHLGGTSGRTMALSFSHDGRWLASGADLRIQHDPKSGDMDIRLWDLASLVPRHRFHGHRGGITKLAFAPDDRRLVSASEDATALIWDTTRLASTPRATSSAPHDPASAWADLGGDDAARAYRASWALSADPDRAAPFLADRLRPVAPDDPDKDTSIAPTARGETLRRLRAIAVLEKLGTPEARRVLERLASGAEDARETRDARAALRRWKDVRR